MWLDPRHALWAYAFRPFFLATALYGTVLIGAWVAIVATGTLPAAFAAQGTWHGHEMIFGFAAAALAGFALTATPSWTGTAPVTGRPLMALFALWVAGRIVMAGAGVAPLWLISALNLAFFPSLRS